MGTALAILGAIALLVLGVLLVVPWLLQRGADPRHAQRAWERQRAGLYGELLRRAAASGRPRGLRWKRCDADSDVTLARDQASGQLLAFVGVTVSFEAIAGGPMEEVEAVGNLRAGTAVFAYERGRWTTDGRVLFNLDPQDALRRYEGRVALLDDAPSASQARRE